MDIGQAQRHKGNHRITFHCQQPNKERKISLEGPKKNDAPIYGPEIVKLPSIALVLFSFPSMTLLLVLQLSPS